MTKLEVERKFLPAPGSLPDLSVCPFVEIEQAYISLDPVIRVRRAGGDYFLTVKGKGKLAREEFEIPLNIAQYDNLLAKIDTHSRPVTKTRYMFALDGGLTAEIDIYGGFLKGLTTIEVEFENELSANEYIPPVWFGKEITFDGRYGNAALSANGIPK